MKNKISRLILLITIATISSIYLSGCMMAGMGMMHGQGSHEMSMEEHNMNNTIIKEYNTLEYKIISEFPTMIMGNSSFCRIKIYNKTTGVWQTDAEVYLEVFTDNTHTDRSANISSFRVKHIKYENDNYVFNPNIRSAGIYRFLFSIERIGSETFNPPIEIEHTMDNQPEMTNNTSHSSTGSILTSPYFYIGTAAMAVAMFFMIR